MDPASTLVGLAEISLALAGFAAIVLVLATRSAALEPDTAANIRVMVLNAVGSAFACLVGVAILALEVPTPLAWRLSSAFVLAGIVAASGLNQLLFLRHLESPNLRLTAIWWSIAVVGCAIHLVNTLGVLGPPSFGLFFLGLVVRLVRVIVFLRFVLP